jgi:hypothetical protein
MFSVMVQQAGLGRGRRTCVTKDIQLIVCGEHFDSGICIQPSLFLPLPYLCFLETAVRRGLLALHPCIHWIPTILDPSDFCYSRAIE